MRIVKAPGFGEWVAKSRPGHQEGHLLYSEGCGQKAISVRVSPILTVKGHGGKA